MKQLLTIALIGFSLACFGQKKESKLDSIKVNAFEEAQLKTYLQGDKARDIFQLQERIALSQQQLQLLLEAKNNSMVAPMARENKQGTPLGLRNGYLIIQK